MAAAASVCGRHGFGDRGQRRPKAPMPPPQILSALARRGAQREGRGGGATRRPAIVEIDPHLWGGRVPQLAAAWGSPPRRLVDCDGALTGTSRPSSQNRFHAEVQACDRCTPRLDRHAAHGTTRVCIASGLRELPSSPSLFGAQAPTAAEKHGPMGGLARPSRAAEHTHTQSIKNTHTWVKLVLAYREEGVERQVGLFVQRPIRHALGP